MPVDARRLVRKMRGGAQAHLIECSDGRFYVVKFLNNPQHRRILINEWIGSLFLDHLRISAPPTAVVNVSIEFIQAYPEAGILHGTRRIPPSAGWHFGSLYPGDPARLAVYDFLPDGLLEGVANLSDFRGALVFDRWMGNADARQSIFFRALLGDRAASRAGFVAQMMDHGYVFGGPEWRFQDSPLAGLYFRRAVYRGVRTVDDFQPWLERVENFPDDLIDRALKQIPPPWLEDDEPALIALLERLMGRRPRLAGLIRESAAAGAGPFPDWRTG